MLRLGGSKTEKQQINNNIIKTVKKREIRVINGKEQYSYNSLDVAREALKKGILKKSKYEHYLEILTYKRVDKVDNFILYDMEYQVTLVKTQRGNELYFNTRKEAVDYCKKMNKEQENMKVEKKVVVKKKEENVKTFRDIAIKVPLTNFYVGNDLTIAVKLKNEGTLTMKDLHLYQYYVAVFVYNFLIRKISKYIKAEGLYDYVLKKGMKTFLADYIFDRELVEKWIKSEIKESANSSTIYYENMFNMFKKEGIISVCGAGYLFDNFCELQGIEVEDSDRIEEINAILMETDFKQIVIL